MRNINVIGKIPESIEEFVKPAKASEKNKNYYNAIYNYQKYLAYPHKKYEVRKINNVYQFITKGDANKNIDNGYRKNSDISGIVKFKIKYIGLPTLWLRSLFEN